MIMYHRLKLFCYISGNTLHKPKHTLRRCKIVWMLSSASFHLINSRCNTLGTSRIGMNGIENVPNDPFPWNKLWIVSGFIALTLIHMAPPRQTMSTSYLSGLSLSYKLEKSSELKILRSKQGKSFGLQLHLFPLLKWNKLRPGARDWCKIHAIFEAQPCQWGAEN